MVRKTSSDGAKISLEPTPFSQSHWQSLGLALLLRACLYISISDQFLSQKGKLKSIYCPVPPSMSLMEAHMVATE